MGQRATIIIVGLVMLGIGAAAGTFGYIWFVGGSGEASQPISAPTLSLDATAAPDPVATQIAQLDTKLDAILAQLESGDTGSDISALSEQITGLEAQVAALNAAVSGIEVDPVIVTATPVPPTVAPEPTVAPTAEAAASAADALTGRGLFRIDTERTTVRFIIDEELEGAPVTVVGVTDQVAGDIIVDFDNPAASQVGEIVINVRTLHTDNEFRDRALRTEILESRLDEYEFANFVPTAVVGLPATVSVDQEISFQIIGDFTVRNITRSITFDVTGRMVTPERLDGLGTTMITRDMYDLNIPSVPGVANVANDVGLEIEFTARLVDEA